MTLPNAPIVSGQDIIRGADGTSCQSAVASGGPYLDFGVLQNEDVFTRQSAAVYGRIVVPLGKRGRRVDCTKLYKLEIARMQMELELLRMGTSFGDALSATPVQELTMIREEEGPVAGGITIGAPAARGAALPSPRSEALAMQAIVPPTSQPSPAPAREPVVIAEAPPPSRPATVPTVRAEARARPDFSGYFAQGGAFATPERAASRAKEVAGAAGRTDTRVLPLRRSSGDTLYRAVVGPMSKDTAEAVCAKTTGACFVTKA